MLIVDSGSTKADWYYINDKGEKTLTHTMGLNPYFHGPDKVFQVLTQKDFEAVVPRTQVRKVFFYGAGCSDDTFCSSMKEGLIKSFPMAEIDVEHDLLGAARATCGRSPGISGILGTGSNSCLYDGNVVTDNITALSHVIGDEGSGVHLGKLLLQAYYYRELPSDLEDLFSITYPEGKRSIIHRVYGENQNVTIAEFAQFLIKNKEHSGAKKLIDKGLREFAIRHLKKYENWRNLEINLVGSIADMLSVELKEIFASEGLKVGKIIRRPIEKLMDFHLH